jgi:TonB family protein
MMRTLVLFTASTLALSAAVTPPRPKHKVEPTYSQEALDAKYQGSVLLRLLIDSSGNVKDPVVVRPLGLGLDEKAIEAVRQWKFEPATKDGEPVEVKANIEINFRLRDKPKSEAK